MSGVGEASLVLGIISSIITVIDATKQVWEAVEDESGLPLNFKKSATKLPLILKLLDDAERYIDNTIDESIHAAFTPTLEDCKVQATLLQQLFAKVIPEESDSRWDRYVKAARTIGKGGRVESLIRAILDDLQLLATQFPESTTPRGKDQLAKAIEEVTKMEPSLPEGFEEAPAFAHYGSGSQNVNTGSGSQFNNNSTGNQNNGPGQQYIGTNHIVRPSLTVHEIDRLCLRFLRCPDTLRIKGKLKENKDKLLHKSIDWILHDSQYINWMKSDDIALLWIKGGAGKGKTMLSIGIIERLSLTQGDSSVVTYFFCQNSDYQLNTLEAIIKGLILRLVKQQKGLMESLRCRWDTANERFTEDVTSWRTLWDIFMEMLEHCRCQRVYIVVDAIDECQSNGMAGFLRRLVRTGLYAPSKVKWLLTSRPLDSAEQELLAGSDQLLVSLELNSKHLSEAVKNYIAFKTDELDRRRSYGEIFRRRVEEELLEKSEGTYLWVSLVCQVLEGVSPDNALITIQELPSGLPPLYDRILSQLLQGDIAVVKRCLRLLKVMMLAYRPLSIAEFGAVTGLSGQLVSIEALVDRCASFVRRQGRDVVFVHQSARDYLAGKNGESILDFYGVYGHGEIAVNCLSHLSQRLKVNLVDLPQADPTRESMTRNELIDSLDYAASFWAQHLDNAPQSTLIRAPLTERGEVGVFLRTKLLEWLECLSLLDKLPNAIEALKTFKDSVKDPPLLALVEDAARFLLRHYHTIVNWPLQIYSSAVVFSPETSIVRRNNLDKLPTWLTNLPQTERIWDSLIQTLTGHEGYVRTVAFSPDGKRIASGSRSGFNLWDSVTGDLQKTFSRDHVNTTAFSPDSKQVASGSEDTTIKLWDAQTGDLQKTLLGHSGGVNAIAFSPDGKQIASGSQDRTIKLWAAQTGSLQRTLVCTETVYAIAFSPNGKQVVSGSGEGAVGLWDTPTGNLQDTLESNSPYILAVAYSPDGKRIASGSGSFNGIIQLWDAQTCNLQKTLAGHRGPVYTVAFSPDGGQIASGGFGFMIKLWDIHTGYLLKLFTGHSDRICAIAFSPDGKRIISGSYDETIKVWDTQMGGSENTPTSLLSSVVVVAFSPDGTQIASGSTNEINLWDAQTGDLQKKLASHIDFVQGIAFSPDNMQIASVGRRTIKLWDAQTGDLQKELVYGGKLFNDIVFSPDGKRIASASWNGMTLWDPVTGDQQNTITGYPGWITALKFSPDGQELVSVLEDTILVIWNIQSNDSQLIPTSHSSRIDAIEFMSHGKQIVSESTDGEVKVWDLVSSFAVPRLGESARLESKPLQRLRAHEQWIFYGGMPVLRLPLDFEPTCQDTRGDQLAIGCRTRRILILDIDRMNLSAVIRDSL